MLSTPSFLLLFLSPILILGAEKEKSAFNQLSELAGQGIIVPAPVQFPSATLQKTNHVEVFTENTKITFKVSSSLTFTEKVALRDALTEFPLKKGLMVLSVGRPEEGEPPVNFAVAERDDLDTDKSTGYARYDRKYNTVTLARWDGALYVPALNHELYHALDDVLLSKRGVWNRLKGAKDEHTVSDFAPTIRQHYDFLVEHCQFTSKNIEIWSFPEKSFLCLTDYFGWGDVRYIKNLHEFFVFHLERQIDQQPFPGLQLYTCTPLATAVEKFVESGGVDPSHF